MKISALSLNGLTKVLTLFFLLGTVSEISTAQSDRLERQAQRNLLELKRRLDRADRLYRQKMQEQRAQEETLRAAEFKKQNARARLTLNGRELSTAWEKCKRANNCPRVSKPGKSRRCLSKSDDHELCRLLRSRSNKSRELNAAALALREASRKFKRAASAAHEAKKERDRLAQMYANAQARS